MTSLAPKPALQSPPADVSLVVTGELTSLCLLSSQVGSFGVTSGGKKASCCCLFGAQMETGVFLLLT